MSISQCGDIVTNASQFKLMFKSQCLTVIDKAIVLRYLKCIVQMCACVLCVIV